MEEGAEVQSRYSYICSVAYVGAITSLQLLVYSHGFERLAIAKQLASYGGIAPFAYQSGISIRGRTSLHPMANKKLTTALHMCALSAIRYAGELKSYFDCKVKGGKNKMSIIHQRDPQ